MASEQKPEITESTYPVAEPQLCEEISERYRWPLKAVVKTGRQPLPYDCVFKGDRKFPKRLNDPELYEKD